MFGNDDNKTMLNTLLATLTDSINVGSQQTANINYTLAPKINITVNFFRGTSTATAPAKYIIEHPNITNGYMVVTNAGNASTVTTPDLPKSSTAYTIYAGACQNGSVPGTYKGSAAVATTISVKVPQIDMTTKHNGSADAQDTVVTDSSCPANSRSFVTTNAGKARQVSNSNGGRAAAMAGGAMVGAVGIEPTTPPV